MQIELNLTFLLNFSRKLFFDKNDVETLFCLKTGFKIGVRIIHGCALYMGKYSTVLFVSSNQQKHKCNLLLVWDFFWYAKNVGICLGRQILKLEFFWV